MLGSDRREALLQIDVFSSPSFYLFEEDNAVGKREFLGDVRLTRIVGYRCYRCMPLYSSRSGSYNVPWHKYLLGLEGVENMCR